MAFQPGRGQGRAHQAGPQRQVLTVTLFDGPLQQALSGAAAGRRDFLRKRACRAGRPEAVIEDEARQPAGQGPRAHVADADAVRHGQEGALRIGEVPHEDAILVNKALGRLAPPRARMRTHLPGDRSGRGLTLLCRFEGTAEGGRQVTGGGVTPMWIDLEPGGQGSRHSHGQGRREDA
jgi:hypothetical protein